MDSQDLQNMLVRIDERVKAIQSDIREINESRQCASNQVKIKTLERMVWGCVAFVAAIGVRTAIEIMKN
ncbi:hypothetical protein [Pseudodesulfovibrio sediminis]|nr:hypothetical protein [Pseudodesulfovibrio sediminis]